MLMLLGPDIYKINEEKQKGTIWKEDYNIGLQ